MSTPQSHIKIDPIWVEIDVEKEKREKERDWAFCNQLLEVVAIDKIPHLLKPNQMEEVGPRDIAEIDPGSVWIVALVSKDIVYIFISNYKLQYYVHAITGKTWGKISFSYYKYKAGGIG